MFPFSPFFASFCINFGTLVQVYAPSAIHICIHLHSQHYPLPFFSFEFTFPCLSGRRFLSSLLLLLPSFPAFLSSPPLLAFFLSRPHVFSSKVRHPLISTLFPGSTLYLLWSLPSVRRSHCPPSSLLSLVSSLLSSYFHIPRFLSCRRYWARMIPPCLSPLRPV